ncbi:MAG TPA: SRPBCC family protein, partial [Acidimicrobiales bacterium]|nr:SRPBCC family protein [Acidimicrobiales bacterium]
MRRTLVRESFDVDVPSAEAWAGLAQVTRWPEWAPHIKRVCLSPSDGLGPGSAGAFRLKGGLRSTFVMTVWEPPGRWTWIGPALGMTILYD